MLGGAGTAYAMHAGRLRASFAPPARPASRPTAISASSARAPAAIRAQVDAVNIKRRAYYTDLAAKRGAKIEEVAATTACELFRTKVGAGQYYRLPDGVWRQRDGGTPIPLPGYCG